MSEASRAAALARLARPGDWIKNVFVLPAFIFSLPQLMAEDRPLVPLALNTVIAFLAFCLISSGFYAINDVVDAERDRQHPLKRKRPVASGVIPAAQASTFGILLVLTAIALSAAVNWLLVMTLLAYAILQVLYNVRIKRVMLVDVVTVALGFALRAAAGAVAIDRPISIWLLLCVFFLCLYLGFIKRLCDLSSAKAAGSMQWRSAAGYDDRMELNWLLGVSAVLAIVTYLMYALSDHAHELFGSRANGFALLSPLVMIAIHRFYRRASRGTSDSPLAALIEDRAVRYSVVLFAVGVLASLYVPFVQEMLDHVFVAGMEE